MVNKMKICFYIKMGPIELFLNFVNYIASLARCSLTLNTDKPIYGVSSL